MMVSDEAEDAVPTAMTSANPETRLQEEEVIPALPRAVVAVSIKEVGRLECWLAMPYLYLASQLC